MPDSRPRPLAVNKTLVTEDNAPGLPLADELPTRRLDRLLHAATEPLTGGLSPISLGLAWADWAWHLMLSPGRQMELAALATQLGRHALTGPFEGHGGDHPDDDPRFRDPAWEAWPFNQLRTGFRHAETFWKEAAVMPGMTVHHAQLTNFFARQALGAIAPANWLPTNPVVLQDAADSRGAHLAQGALHWLQDMAGPGSDAPGPQAPFRPGVEVAVTPGKVVLRNRLIELIRYDAQTPTVHPEPLLIVPSWIMKYYILDLSPHNSLVRFLVERGHTVYMVSWHNPDAEDHDLSMDDYLRLGVFDALKALGDIEGRRQKVHAMGYCLGGTLLAIAAAALARQDAIDGAAQLPPLASMSLLAAQTDFSEPGELGLFIDESQIGYLDDITRGQGYLSGRQMAGSFQFLHSRDLLWTRRMREYLMGERETRSDLMSWNADTTRMPARMHHEYLVSLYLNNQLATSTYPFEGHAVSLGDIRLPVFLVGTERDHVSPWHSVYKLHHLCDSEITFVLASGGHNAGIVAEPGHPKAAHRIATAPAQGHWTAAGQWAQRTPKTAGSWWPAWQNWLARRSSPRKRPRALPEGMALGDAPGRYVLQCYTD